MLFANLFADIDEIIDGTPEEKPMTNADRIRAMSDEELAEWIEADGWGCEECFENKIGLFDTCDMMCREHCLEWLQQPAEEVHHE